MQDLATPLGDDHRGTRRAEPDTPPDWGRDAEFARRRGSWRRPRRVKLDVRQGASVGSTEAAASAELDRTVRQVFALTNQHMRRELSDLARRLND